METMDNELPEITIRRFSNLGVDKQINDLVMEDARLFGMGLLVMFLYLMITLGKWDKVWLQLVIPST